MIQRKLFYELLGFNLYKTRDTYFYAWSHKRAVAKQPGKTIWYVTNHGGLIPVSIPKKVKEDQKAKNK